MATRTAKLRVELDGEKQYKQALSELNKGNQVLASEMRKLSAEYKNNDKSVEALTKRGDVLERQLLQQKDKVQTLRDALANAAKQYGEADKRTQDWQIKLNDAEAAQFKLEQAIEENNAEIKKQDQAMVEEGKAVGKFGDQVQDLAGKLGIRLPEGAKKALNGMRGFSAGTVAAMGAAAAAVAGLIKAVKALNDMTLEQASRADALQTQNMITGVDTQTLQQWQYAQELIDVSADTITGALTKITNSAYDAAKGNEKLSEAFATLGVAVQNSDGSLRSAEEIFYDVIDALGGVEDQTTRDAIAMDLMGKSAQDLNPLILQGSDALRDLADEAEKTGYVLDESQIKKLTEVDDAYQRTQLQIEATKNKLAAEFAPASKAAMETFGDVVQKSGQVLVDSGLIQNTAKLIENIAGVVEGGLKLAQKIPNWLNPIKNLSNQFEILNRTISGTLNLLGITKNVQSGYGGLGSDIAGAEWKDDVQAWVSAGGTIIGDWNYNDFDKSTGKLTRQFESGYVGDVVSYQTYSEDQIRRLLGRNAGGSANWRGGLTWVGEAGPELVSLPRGSAIYSNQESRAIAATGTDTSRLEALMERNVQILEQISGEFSGLRVKGRMV